MSTFNGAVKVDMPVASGIFNGMMGAVTVGMPTAAATLGYAFYGAVTVNMPVAAGTVTGPTVFNGAVTVDSPTVAGVVVNPGVFSGAVKVNMSSAAAVLGYALMGAVKVDMPVSAGSFGSVTIFNGAVTVDMPLAAATLLQAVLEARTVLVMNLKNKVVSIYENYNFNSACKLNGAYLGADSASGIHILSGPNDNGAHINASITMGDSDFGLPNIKMIPEMFVDYSGEGLEVFVARDQTAEMGAADNEETGPYPVPATADGKTETKRAKLPGGFRGGNWQFRVANVDGGAINIQSIGIPVEKSQRRLN